MRLFRIVIFLSTCFAVVLACTSSGNSGKRGRGKNNKNPTTNSNDSIQKLLGKNVQTNPYDESGYNSKNGVANGPSDLSCTFDNNCCWKNVQPPADTMQWVKATGSPDANLLQNNFGTSTAPNGGYLVIASDRTTSSTDNGRFKSCTIKCAAGPVTVSLKHWATQGVRLQVCNQDPSGDSGPLLSCQDVDPNNVPGPATVTIPGSPNMNIVIVASNFVSSQGSVAMIDDINVDYQSCDNIFSSPPPTGTGPSPPPIGGNVCQAVVCNFEAGNPCAYTDVQNVGGGPSQPWQVQKGRFQNPLTGIRGASDGNYYSAVYLKPTESAALQTTPTTFDQDRVVRFDSYRATDDVFLRGCCDKPDSCPYDSHKSVQISDFQKWKTISFVCPKGTQKVLFYAKNDGRNQGAVGLDNINLLIPSGGSPDQAQQVAC